MTTQLGGQADGALAALQERVARARRSVVAIRAGALSATGWIALANGVVVTSRRGIGYPTDVSLALEDGRSVAGRVVVVDVGRDVALVLPLEPLGGGSLSLRAPTEPRLGDHVAVLSCLPGQSLRLAVARVCQIRKGDGGIVTFEIDAAAPFGAPVLDAEGRVLGMIAAHPLPCGDLPGHAIAIASSALQSAVASADRPTSELRDRSPVLRCPGCDEPFDVDSDRCLACGRLLPHAFAPSIARAGAERVLRQSLLSLGFIANRARVGALLWRIAHRPHPAAEVGTQVDIEIDEHGRTLALRAPVVGLPAANHEPFYRFLLTMNDQTTGEFRISVAGDEVSVSCVASLEGASEHDVAVLIDEIVQMADEFRRTLADTFEAVPRFDSAAR